MRGRNLEGWHICCRHWGVGNDGHIRNLLWKTQWKRSNISQRKWKIYFPAADGTVKLTLWRRSGSENILLNPGTPDRGEEQGHLPGESDGSSSTPLQDSSLHDGEQEMISGPCQETSFSAITLNPESNFTRREKNHSLPLKYIDLSKTTHTNLGVKHKKRIDDYWNIDGSRDLSDYWTGFNQFILLKEKPPNEDMWSGRRLTRKQLASRPDHLWPELWDTMGKNAKLKEKQKWSHDKLHLDNARKLRGIYFHWPGGQGIQRNHQDARKKLETPMAPAMPCKRSRTCKHGETRGKTNEIKSKLACILEASESTRLRMEESLPSHHEDHIAGKEDTIHCNIIIWITNLFLCPKPWKFQQQRQQWIRNGKNWKRFWRGTWRTS